MQGKILEFSIDNNTGVISGEDGNRYGFQGGEVHSDVPPRAGDNVDFQATGDQATGIYISAPAAPPVGAKNKVVAGILALFLGGLGIHKFYLGYTAPGVIMLIGTLFGFVLLFIPNLIIGIICLVEAIIYLIKSDEEFHNTYVVNRRAWF